MAAPITIGLFCHDNYPTTNDDRWKWQEIQGNLGLSGIQTRKTSGVGSQIVYAAYINRPSDPTGITQILPPAQSAQYILTDGSGNRITRVPGDPDYVLDITNQNLWADAIDFLVAKCQADGWDGVWLDELNEEFAWGGWSATPTKWNTDAKWQTAVTNYVTAIADGLRDHGLTCYINLGTTSSNPVAQPWALACTGSSQEYWMCPDGENTGTPDLSSAEGAWWWNFTLQWAEWVERESDRVPVYHVPSTDPDRIRAALLTLLLVTEGRSVFGAGSVNYNDDGPWIPEYDQLEPLGSPLGQYTQTGSVYSRQFEGGSVSLNTADPASASILLTPEDPGNMAATFATSVRNSALDAIGTTTNSWISLHTDTPTSGNEVSGGSYARVQTTWAASSNGSKAGSQVTINVPASTTIKGYAINTAVTGGAIVVSDLLPSSETYGGAGTYQLTITLTD